MLGQQQQQQRKKLPPPRGRGDGSSGSGSSRRANNAGGRRAASTGSGGGRRSWRMQSSSTARASPPPSSSPSPLRPPVFALPRWKSAAFALAGAVVVGHLCVSTRVLRAYTDDVAYNNNADVDGWLPGSADTAATSAAAAAAAAATATTTTTTTASGSGGAVKQQQQTMQSQRATAVRRRQDVPFNNSGNGGGEGVGVGVGEGDSDSFGACLLLKDDNHWLVEWLAYHHFALPLRHLVAYVDPRSKTSPQPVLDRWKGLMEIEVWNRTKYYLPDVPDFLLLDPTLSDGHLEHRAVVNVQSRFLKDCILHYKTNVRWKSWIVLVDGDEFVAVNDWSRDRTRPAAYRPDVPGNDEPGSVMKFLKRELARYPPGKGPNKHPCVRMHRLQMCLDEDDVYGNKTLALGNGGGNNSEGQIDWTASDFLTFNFKRGEKGRQVKNMIHVGSQLLSEKYLKEALVLKDEKPYFFRNYNVHNPVPRKCPAVSQSGWEKGPYLPREDALFQVYHYSGTLRQREFRTDLRGDFGNRSASGTPPAEVCLNVSATDLQPWLRSFVNMFCLDEARRLLDGVGRVDSWPPYERAISDEDLLMFNITHMRSVARRREDVNALAYLRSFNVISRRPLKFLHVPKTGGTSIEAIAARNNVSWGICAFPGHDDPTCPVATGSSQLNGTWPHSDWWHLTRQQFPLAGVDPYRDAEIFTVVRDPYSRMVSEFNYQCGRSYHCSKDRRFEKRYMNAWLQENLRPTPGDGHITPGLRRHYVPQYSFVVAPNNVRMSDHVLRMEHNMSATFERLTRAYSRNFTLNQRLNTATDDLAMEGNRLLTVEELDPTTIQKLNERFPQDAVAFGYDVRRLEGLLEHLLSLNRPI